MAKSNEPIVWSLFSAGGVVAAFVVPIHVVMLGIALPLGWIALDYQSLVTLVQNPLSKVYLFVLISLVLFHWAHRFRFTLVDLGLKKLEMLISIVCYVSAVVGTGYSAYALWTM